MTCISIFAIKVEQFNFPPPQSHYWAWHIKKIISKDFRMEFRVQVLILSSFSSGTYSPKEVDFFFIIYFDWLPKRVLSVKWDIYPRYTLISRKKFTRDIAILSYSLFYFQIFVSTLIFSYSIGNSYFLQQDVEAQNDKKYYSNLFQW